MKLSKTTTCVLVVVAAFVAVSCLPSAAAFPKPLAAVAADLMDKMGVDPPETQWFTQPVDHFNESDTRQFKQRYWVNDAYVNSTSAPIIININGEGPANGLFAVEGITAILAQEMGGLALSIEHRYYGESVPVPDLSIANLAYLTSQQALADFAAFVTATKAAMKMNDSPVVVVGGSYSGAMSSWARQKYPDVFAGSLAFSAPVEATNTFFLYDETVIASANMIEAGCADVMGNATATAVEMLATVDGQEKLAAMFNTCQPLTSEAIQGGFLYNLPGVLEGAVQYDNPPSFPLNAVCKALVEGKDNPIGTWADITVGESGGMCMDNDVIASGNNITVDTTAIGGRMWWWQKTTEFGYWKEGKGVINAAAVDEAYFGTVAEGMFGLPLGDVNATNAYFGGNTPSNDTNTFFINGLIDPWHTLSVLSPLGPSTPVFIYPDAGHCAPMLPPTSEDPAGVVEARALALKYAQQWVAAART